VTRAKRHLLEVKLLPCVLCSHLGLGESPADAHHLFDGHQRSDWLVAPLCPAHHRGPNGFHGLGGEPGFFARYRLKEVDLLRMTMEALHR
jgi:hypothetical protein